MEIRKIVTQSRSALSGSSCTNEVTILQGSTMLITRSVMFFWPSLLTMPFFRQKKPMPISENIMNCSRSIGIISVTPLWFRKGGMEKAGHPLP